MTQNQPLRLQASEYLDGESNPIRLDVCYEVRGSSLGSTIREIKGVHGDQVKLLPLSGRSAGGGVFQVQAVQGSTIAGLSISAAVTPRVRRADGVDVDIMSIELDEIVIDDQNYYVYAGAAITLQQLNRGLADHLGVQYQVLGADLTSFAYAQVGSTFMTGGMGPQRRYFSDSVVEISLHDGERLQSVSGVRLGDFAGTYGWTGLVSAVKCRYHVLPIEEFSFSVPVKNTPENIASVLNHFAGHVYLQQTADFKVLASQGGSTLILGLEHITVDSMQPLLDLNLDNTATRIAREIVEKCQSADADGMIFVNGLSEGSVDETISEFVDDVTADTLTIAGIDLECTYYFPNLDVMRDLREAVSYAARNQEPKGSYSYKGHTDANIWVNPALLESSLKSIWKAYLDYIDKVKAYLNTQPTISGEILIYGHLNPVGFDPHNRITIATENESHFQATIDMLEFYKQELILELAGICESTGCVFTGGEKGAGSDHELLLAFETPDDCPQPLAAKFKRQSQVIRDASPTFKWRALAPYN